MLVAIAYAIAAFQMTAQSQVPSDKRIEGTWEYKTVFLAGKELAASEQNACGYRDVLEIKNSNEVQEYTFGELQFSGRQIGISNAKICVISLIVYKYVVVANSCNNTWIRLLEHPKRLVCMREGLVVEYEIERLNKKSMILLKIKEIVNYGEDVPERIELERVERKRRQ